MNRLSKISALVIAIVLMSSISCMAGNKRIFDHWVSPHPHRSVAMVDVEADYYSLEKNIVVIFYAELEDVDVEIYQDGVLYDEDSLLFSNEDDELVFSVFEEGTYTVVVKSQGETIYTESFTVD